MRKDRDCHLATEHDAGAGEHSEYEPPEDWQELIDEIIDLRERLAEVEAILREHGTDLSVINEALGN